MRYKRNEFLNPRIYDPEYMLIHQRRNDLRILIEKYLPKYSDAVVLDFGSRKAPYKEMFSKKIKRFLAADLTDEQKPPQVDVIIGYDGHLQQASASVDVVLSLQVLEHVDNIDVYLNEANRILKPGGLLWLTTHGMWPYHPTPDDYRRWTLSGLCKTIESWFSIIDTGVMLGGPAYAFMIYVHILWEASLKLNALQTRFLNKITGSKRWGKVGDRKKRIKNPYLYIGFILFRLLVIPFNLIMVIIDYLTPIKIKKNEAAVFRIAARKYE